MIRYYLLGAINVILCFLYTYMLLVNNLRTDPVQTFASFIKSYSPTTVLLFSIGTTAFTAYSLLKKQKIKPSLFVASITTLLSAFFWPAILFLGFFIPYQFMPLLAILIPAVIFYTLRNKARKNALFLSLTTALVFMLVIVSIFEESYCWDKGAKAEKNGPFMVTATEEDAKKLKEFGVKAGNKLGTGFRIHMLCHDTFNVFSAIKDTYSF